MADNKTAATAVAVDGFISGLPTEARRADARALDALFRQATGFTPRMWGPGIVGYGRYAYRYDSGRSGEMCAAGFSPRGAAISVYGVIGADAATALLDQLGKHRLGKGCLYIGRLADVDQAVLDRLIRAGLADLGARYEVHPE
jgi:Domain of unknown function (DU1801)